MIISSVRVIDTLIEGCCHRAFLFSSEQINTVEIITIYHIILSLIHYHAYQIVLTAHYYFFPLNVQ
jgi:hypothetical protein